MKLKQILNAVNPYTWIGAGSFGDGYVGGTQSASYGGQTVTPESALKLSAVWSCVSLISETIATLPLKLYTKAPDGRIEAESHQLYRALKTQPNMDMSAVQFWQAFITSMLLWGNGYAKILFDTRGKAIGLTILHPALTSVRCLGNGQLEYRYTRKGKTETFNQNQVFHVPSLTLDGRTGLSPIRYGAKVFGGALAADAASASTFEKGMHKTTYFKIPRILKKDQRDEARETIKSYSGAMQAGAPVLLEDGMDAGTIGIDPKDAQLLESRSFSVEDICRWYRVPPWMVGHSEKSTSWGSGIEQQMIAFITFTLNPWLVRIQQGISRQLLPVAEQRTHFAEFSVQGLLKGDSTARAAFYSTGLQNGWINRETVARLENLPIPDGGHIYTVQSNLVELMKLGQNDGQSNQLRDLMRNFLGIKDGDSPDEPEKK